MIVVGADCGFGAGKSDAVHQGEKCAIADQLVQDLALAVLDLLGDDSPYRFGA